MKSVLSARLIVLFVALAATLMVINAPTEVVAQGNSANANKQIKILSPGVELTEVIPSAEKCPKQRVKLFA